jgi:hypothetical protein
MTLLMFQVNLNYYRKNEKDYFLGHWKDPVKF